MICDAYIALGSNLGDREGYLSAAVSQISGLRETRLKAVSKVYETKPVGYAEQGSFLNMAVCVETGLEPASLLEELQRIERSLDRVRYIHWGPRTIDLDILLYGDLTVDTQKLVIPHPRMAERAFVLVPLKDIHPGFVSDGTGIDTMIDRCGDRDGVRFYKQFAMDGCQL